MPRYAMDAQQNLPQGYRDIRFRVLIFGMDVFPTFALPEQMQERCPSCGELYDTTASPEIHRSWSIGIVARQVLIGDG